MNPANELLLSRRRWIGNALAAVSLGAPFLHLHAQSWRDRNPFTLGVASGCPTSDGVVLWTRLAIDPLVGGDMPSDAVEVRWELAHDEGFRRIAARGTAIARAFPSSQDCRKSESAHASTDFIGQRLRRAVEMANLQRSMNGNERPR